MTSTVSSSSNASALQQMMLMLQQLAQQNAANTNTTDATQGADSSSVGATGAAANTNLVSSPPAFSGDMLLVLMQGQSLTSSGSGSADGQSSGQTGAFGQDFQQLAQAIQSGNLSGAQQAYTTLSQLIGSQDQTGTADVSASGTAAASTSSNPFLQALNQIGTDLQSGNITGAQQTLSSLQQAQDEHHHGGDGGGAGGAGGSSSSGGSDASTTVQSEEIFVNPDGSTTTLITYADGSTSTTNTPSPASTASGGTSGSTDPNSLQNLLASLEQSLSV